LAHLRHLVGAGSWLTILALVLALEHHLLCVDLLLQHRDLLVLPHEHRIVHHLLLLGGHLLHLLRLLLWGRHRRHSRHSRHLHATRLAHHAHGEAHSRHVRHRELRLLATTSVLGVGGRRLGLGGTLRRFALLRGGVSDSTFILIGVFEFGFLRFEHLVGNGVGLSSALLLILFVSAIGVGSLILSGSCLGDGGLLLAIDELLVFGSATTTAALLLALLFALLVAIGLRGTALSRSGSRLFRSLLSLILLTWCLGALSLGRTRGLNRVHGFLFFSAARSRLILILGLLLLSLIILLLLLFGSLSLGTILISLALALFFLSCLLLLHGFTLHHLRLLFLLAALALLSQILLALSLESFALGSFALSALRSVLLGASLRRLPFKHFESGILLARCIPRELSVDPLLIEVEVVANARNVVNVESAVQLLSDIVKLGIVDAQLFLVGLQLDNVLNLLVFVDSGLLPVLLMVGATAATPPAAATATASEVAIAAATTAPATTAVEATSTATERALSIVATMVVVGALRVDCIGGFLTRILLLRICTCIVFKGSLEGLAKGLIGGSGRSSRVFLEIPLLATEGATASTATTVEAATATWSVIAIAIVSTAHAVVAGTCLLVIVLIT